eukprot:gene9511-18579_t
MRVTPGATVVTASCSNDNSRMTYCKKLVQTGKVAVEIGAVK